MLTSVNPSTSMRCNLETPLHFTNGDHPFNGIEWTKRDALIANPDGSVVFEMRDVEAPASWSQLAVDIAASKYFRKAGVPTETGHESSVRQLVDRVTHAVGRAGFEQGYFDKEGQSAFESELAYMLVRQMAAFNSPVWFNCGLREAYGITGSPSGRWYTSTEKCVEAKDEYTHPAVSACFIQTIEDDLMDIADAVKREMRVFKGGGGSGMNYSRVRGAGEPLAGGGRSSGLMSFLHIFDAAAGATKSGGTCLAPDQRVFTNRGPVSVKDLAESGRDFVVLSYDPPAGRYKAKTARAWLAGEKKVVEVTTDKGRFKLTYDHPMRLSDHSTCLAGDLRPGMSLLACSVDRQGGYLRVHLRDGRKGTDRFHRLIAADVMGHDLEDRVVHHEDENPDNNEIGNLEVMTQGEHAAHHMAKLVEAGDHPFQRGDFARPSGEKNGMHKNSAFWQDGQKVAAYKAKQSAILSPARAAHQQKSSTRQRMLNLAYKIINAGYSIDTFDDYIVGRRRAVGRIGVSLDSIRSSIERHFGSFENFVAEVKAGNHRVVSVRTVGVMPVYDVEVDCPTADDKTWRSGHNFVIWPSDDPVGRGVVVYNTRRAARMVVLDADHPDIEEFIDWKVGEEKKAAALIAAGYSGGMDGEAIRSVSGQNANNSVGLTDEFMNAVLADGDWQTKFRTNGEVAKTLKAKKLMRQIAEAAWACADPGLQFQTTINKWNTVPINGQIRACNPCVVGSTLVQTERGLIQIRQLMGRAIHIRTEDGLSPITRVWSNGVKPVFRLRTKSGYSVELTADHRVHVEGKRDVEAQNLQPGDKLKLLHGVFGPEKLDTKTAELIGLALGDGCGSDDDSPSGHRVTWTLGAHEAEMLMPYVAHINSLKGGGTPGGEVSLNESPTGVRFATAASEVVQPIYRTATVDKGSDQKGLRPHGLGLDRETTAAVLRGLFTADGTVNCDGPGGKCAYVSLDSTSLRLLQQVQVLLLNYSIKSKLYLDRRGGKLTSDLPDGKGGTKPYDVKEYHSLRISRSSRVLFERKIGFLPMSEKVAQLA